MQFVQYRTGKDDEGRRLDKVLRILFPDTPLSTFYSALRKGLIRINEKKVKQDYHIQKDDVVCVAEFLDFNRREIADSAEKQQEHKNSETILHTPYDDLCIFRNEHLVFLNKPYDVPVHETASYKGMTLNQYVLKKYCPAGDSLSFTPGPLHRLDRKTTGIIAFSQSLNGARIFTELLKMHKVKKTYLTIVDGAVSDELSFTDTLLKNVDTGEKNTFHTVKVDAQGKIAITKVKPLAYGSYKGKEITFAEVCIETGRTHQIRSQCAYHGYPLTGDASYGGSHSDGFFLHAWKLEISEPNALGLPRVLSAQLPERFRDFVEKYLPTADTSLYNI